MKIAITSLYLPSGSKIGVGYQVHGLANALIDRGHRVTVFSQTGPSPDSKYDVVVAPPRNRARTFGFAWDLRDIDFTEFDVLNAHGDDWFLWGRKRPRHIHTYHGSCLAETLHAHGLPAKTRMAMLAACELSSASLADVHVAVSANTCRYLPFVSHVIPCGVDLRAFSPGGGKATRPTILFVGTMHGRKRGAMLVDIFENEVRREIPDAELWAVCEDTIDRDGVTCFGRVDTPFLADLYRHAWAFCLPSTYEGFGVPYIEAMASGAAVVATPNVGACEVTQGGKYGMLAADNVLGKTLVQVLRDQDLRSTLQTAGLKRAQDFSWDTVCAQYEDLYGGATITATEPL